MADVLQRLVRHEQLLEHPLVDGEPCSVLPYADDTMIIMLADRAAAHRLKELLDMYAAASGLTINFSKSTLVPMHLDAAALEDIRSELGCRVEGCPQTCLGLPLTAEKLNLAHFSPLIAIIDKYLSGWTAILLFSGGRIVPLNVVLDALSTFAMGAVELPPVLLHVI